MIEYDDADKVVYPIDLCHEGCARMAGYRINKSIIFGVWRGDMARLFGPARLSPPGVCVCCLLSFPFFLPPWQHFSEFNRKKVKK
ncbi:hypothetical protein MIMGU_mgv1a017281mg [Erythranthe guttata]|uniref:Uncharacterized protein n=1 Tax=Erythranthe guttata TaxID=4155 RepID=A0A022RYL4_ERYGU|nr:hypothetical protein MIMGU_mgv1a017281mg [Erythranthe guttata]